MNLKDMTTEDRLSFMEDKIALLEHENELLIKQVDRLELHLQQQIDALINYTMQMKNDWGMPNDVF